MKNTFKLLAAAVAILASASCVKENTPEVGAETVRTFTASLAADSKIAVDATGKVTWTAGDKIVVYNGNNTENVTGTANFNTGNLQTITVTDQMISDAGRTLTFTTTLEAPKSGKWYFYATNNVDVIYMIRSNANAICSPVGFTLQQEVPFVASASCNNGSSSLNFKHTLGYIRMTASSWVYKIHVSSNAYDASATGDNKSILKAYDLLLPAGNTTLRNDPKDNAYRLDLNDVPVNAPFYVALTPYTHQQGITIEVFTSTSSWNASPKAPEKTVTITKPFTVTAGKIIDFGNILANRSQDQTYYEMWEAGLDILIDGKVYNKATYGAGTLVSSDLALATNPSGGIYFVEPEATVTIGNNWGNRIAKKTLIIGNKKGTKANVVVGAGGPAIVQQAAKELVFKNVNFTVNYGFAFQIMGNLDAVVFDACHIRGNGKLCVIEGSPVTIKSLSFVNNEWAQDNKNNYITRGVEKTFEVSNINFSNNVIYAKTATTEAAMSINTDNSTLATTQSVVFNNNTFVNVAPYNNVAYVYYISDYKIEAKNNLLYYDRAAQAGNWNISRRTDNDNNISTSYTFSDNASYIVNRDGKGFFASWAPRINTTSLSSNPLSALDYTKGEFTNTTSYGATR